MDMNQTTKVPQQLNLDALISQGRERRQKQKALEEERLAKEAREREERLKRIDIEMRKAIPPELHPYLKPYAGRVNTENGHCESRQLAIPGLASIWIYLFYDVNYWKLTSGKTYQDSHWAYNVIKLLHKGDPEEQTTQVVYEGNDLAMALSIAEDVFKEEELEMAEANKAVKLEPVYEAVDQAIQSEPDEAVINSPFTPTQDKYLRKLVMAICNQFFGG
jgi:hypothetical protein